MTVDRELSMFKSLESVTEAAGWGSAETMGIVVVVISAM